MSFKMTLTIDVEDNPDAVGEGLRSLFFHEEIEPTSARMREVGCQPYRRMGCNDTFDWQKDVKELPALPVLMDEDEECEAFPELNWTRGEKNGIECRYFWDGDGTLAFKLPDGCWLVNYDCKKNHGWELLEYGEDIT